MPRKVGITALAVLLVAVTFTVANAAGSASGGSGKHRVTTQAYQWRADPLRTTSEVWKPLRLRGGDQILVVGRGRMTATLSGDFVGAPMRFRLVGNGRVMRPGPTAFTGRPGSSSFSYTFVAQPVPEETCYNVHAEWRSPTGREIVMKRASLVVNYHEQPPAPDTGCG